MLLKLPNILSREARPFDPETFADEGMDEEEAVVPGAGIGEFFPYVSVALETAPISAQ